MTRKSTIWILCWFYFKEISRGFYTECIYLFGTIFWWKVYDRTLNEKSCW